MIKEVELVPAPNIFHDDKHGLKHELIDTRKARQVVTALKQIKSQLGRQAVIAAAEGVNAADKTILSDTTSLQDALSITIDGRLSVNMHNYQRNMTAVDAFATTDYPVS